MQAGCRPWGGCLVVLAQRLREPRDDRRLERLVLPHLAPVGARAAAPSPRTKIRMRTGFVVPSLQPLLLLLLLLSQARVTNEVSEA